MANRIASLILSALMIISHGFFRRRTNQFKNGLAVS